MTKPSKQLSVERVLVVDDEQTLVDAIAFNLRREGLEVIVANTGTQALERMSDGPDAVVLDVMIPEIDGFEVCRKIRKTSTVPILFLSARGEEIDRVVGLEIGADDYLVKPFAMRELVARVRAMLRRRKMVAPPGDGGQPVAVGPTGGQLIHHGDLSIDLARRQVTLAGKLVTLNPKEFDLLAYFARHAGVVMSRTALLREVWGYEHRMDTRTVDVHVSWLRQKLERDPGRPKWFQTVRGHGYRFAFVENPAKA